VSRYWSRCGERGDNLFYVIWIRRSNPVESIRIVNGRLSIRCVVGDLGFCDLDSPDISWRAIWRRACVTLRALATRVLIGFTAGLNNNTDAIVPPLTATNLLQRLLEPSPVVLPLNVLMPPISNIDRVQCDSWVRDGWKNAAADDHNHYDYA
jgi:hypothetical protein